MCGCNFNMVSAINGPFKSDCYCPFKPPRFKVTYITLKGTFMTLLPSSLSHSPSLPCLFLCSFYLCMYHSVCASITFYHLLFSFYVTYFVYLSLSFSLSTEHVCFYLYISSYVSHSSSPCVLYNVTLFVYFTFYTLLIS